MIPHMETGIPHFHRGMSQFPFLYEDPYDFFGDAMAPGA